MSDDGRKHEEDTNGVVVSGIFFCFAHAGRRTATSEHIRTEYKQLVNYGVEGTTMPDVRGTPTGKWG